MLSPSIVMPPVVRSRPSPVSPPPSIWIVGAAPGAAVPMIVVGTETGGNKSAWTLSWITPVTEKLIVESGS